MPPHYSQDITSNESHSHTPAHIMPTCGGPVYQPTTVSYEPRSAENNGNGGLGFLGPASSIGITSPMRVFRKPIAKLGLLLLALVSLAAGIAMLASGTVDLIENQEFVQHQMIPVPAVNSNNNSVHVEMQSQGPDSEMPLGIVLGGVLLICLGFVGLGVYVKVSELRRNCVCPCSCTLFDKKQSLARQLQCQSSGGGGCGQGIMALNPSTDPLVSHTQYAPVSELPSLRAEDEERRNLMPDNKDCLSSAEESDRMLEPDPRIVLRPMGRLEDA